MIAISAVKASSSSGIGGGDNAGRDGIAVHHGKMTSFYSQTSQYINQTKSFHPGKLFRFSMDSFCTRSNKVVDLPYDMSYTVYVVFIIICHILYF